MKYSLGDVLDTILYWLVFIMISLGTIVISLLLIAIIYTLCMHSFDLSSIGGC